MSATRTETAKAYREAARLMEREAIYFDGPVTYACHALELVEFGHASWADSKYCSPLRDVFDPEREGGSAWLCDATVSTEARKEIRILALCFMAAMVEAGDA